MRAGRAAIVLALALALALDAQAQEPDPWRGVNRPIFTFNDKLDRWVLEPVARAWDWVAPDRVQRSVANFFTNLRFPIVAVNDLLQAKPRHMAVDFARFAVNTTVGVAGFLDPATRIGLEKFEEDFGQTLGVWGVPSGPYLVLPVFGPSSPRDALGLAVDTALSVVPFFVPWWASTGAGVASTVNRRALVIEDIESLKEASLDYYAAVRNGYLQQRRAAIRDEAPEGERDVDDEGLYDVMPTR
jgi:phospholipid-binding lipoprotein MlaA